MHPYRAMLVVGTGSLACGLLVAGCTPSAPEIAGATAKRDALHHVENVAATPIHNFDWRAEDIVRDLGQAQGIEVMRVTGESKNDAAGVAIIVRTHATATEPLKAANGHATLDLLLCYQITYKAGLPRDFRVDEVACPSGAPLAIPADPQLPDDIEQTLKGILSGDPPPSLGTVRDAVNRLDLEPGVRRDVAEARGVIGVALRASQFDCVMARRVGTQAQVWRPSHVQLAPGELSCAALVAAGGEGLQAPH
ncbi:MAG: hypothetical protein J2P15_24250 [Micromonosporaceae bacterium]|nr:hypothetical protein [Micromonosporaceae bacterium]